VAAQDLSRRRFGTASMNSHPAYLLVRGDQTVHIGHHGLGRERRTGIGTTNALGTSLFSSS
jgi:hypothetical protein